jgi:hypothetical protein
MNSPVAVDEHRRVAPRLLRAWVATAGLLVLWIALTRLGGLPLGAVGWALIGALLAIGTARATQDSSWYHTGLWLAVDGILLAVLHFVPSEFTLLVWFGFVLYVPARISTRAARALQNRPPTRRFEGWLAATLYRAAIVGATVIAVSPVLGSDRSAGEDPSKLTAVAGCYSTWLSPWIPSFMSGHSQTGIIPARLQLDTIRGRGSPAATSSDIVNSRRTRLERGQHLIRPGWKGGATWAARSSVGVQLFWSTGFYGANARLVRIGTSLVGPVDAFTDVVNGRPMPGAWLWLRRIPCDGMAMDSVHPR